MSENTARIVFAAIMGAGSLVWLWSLVMALRLGRVGEGGAGGWADERFRGRADSDGAVERGERTVRGQPEQLSKEIVRAILQSHLGGSLFEVVERTDRRVALKKTGPLLINQPPGLYFSEAEFDLEPAGGDTVRVRYSLGFARLLRRMRRLALGIILGLGLPVLLAVGILIWIYVIPSDSAALRGQVFQCLQIVHVLWPPFLFLYIYSIGRRRSRAFVANLLTTLDLID